MAKSPFGWSVPCFSGLVLRRAVERFMTSGGIFPKIAHDLHEHRPQLSENDFESQLILRNFVSLSSVTHTVTDDNLKEAAVVLESERCVATEPPGRTRHAVRDGIDEPPRASLLQVFHELVREMPAHLQNIVIRQLKDRSRCLRDPQIFVPNPFTHNCRSFAVVIKTATRFYCSGLCPSCQFV